MVLNQARRIHGKENSGYDPDVESAKGAALTAASYDSTQTIVVTAKKVTVGRKPGIAEITGWLPGRTTRAVTA